LRFNVLVVSPSRDREALEQAVVRGSELLKQGKIDQAQRAFRAALEIEPENPRVLALLGLSHFRANELAEARPIYEQLVDRSPTDASHRLNLGLVYLKLNDADKAIEALEASRALDPSQGRAVSYLGLAYARAGRYAEAYRAFLNAGQNDLAIEIEVNLGAAERDRIHVQIGRTPQGPLITADGSGARQAAAVTVPRTPTPASSARTKPPSQPPVKSRTPTPIGIPRTKPPSAPPAKSRTPSQGYPVIQATDVELDFSSEPEPRPEPLPAPPAVVSPAALAGAPRRAAGKYTESMQFVMPKLDPAVPQASPDGASMISRAVASATPSPAGAMRTRTGGGILPRPLSDLATDDLVRPDDGDDPFEIGANGALIIRVTDRVMTRLDGVHITGGDLGYELAMRRSRGHNTEEVFDHGGSQLHAVSGHGYLIAVPGKHAFSAVSLDDDILYLREDLVFAFQASLRWENGNVPGLRGKLPVVQFRGSGALALRLVRPLVRVKLPAQGLVFIDAERLAGWIGRVIPRAVVPPPGGPLGTMCVECTGEGVVLVEPAADDLLAAPRAAVRPGRPAASEPSPLPSPPAASTPSPSTRPGSDAGADLAAELDLIDRLDEL
jgi:predicted negative regulator of RcsB-dependent stress response